MKFSVNCHSNISVRIDSPLQGCLLSYCNVDVNYAPIRNIICYLLIPLIPSSFVYWQEHLVKTQLYEMHVASIT